MKQVKSKHRVADHGEVFTPAWLVEAMLDPGRIRPADNWAHQPASQ